MVNKRDHLLEGILAMNFHMLSTIFRALITLGIWVMIPIGFLSAQTIPNDIRALAWSPSGTTVAIGGLFDGQPGIRLYDTNGQLVKQLSAQAKVLSISWSPDGTKIAGYLANDMYSIWAVSTESVLVTFEQPYSTGDFLVYWRPDGGLLATIRGRNVEMRDPSTGAIVSILVSPGGLPDDIASATWSLDGTQFITVSSDDVVRFWDIAAETVANTIPVADSVTSIALGPDGTQLALGNGGNFINVIDPVTGTTLATLQTADFGVGYQIGAVRWHPKGEYIAGSSTNRITVWDMTTGQIINTLAQHPEGDLGAVGYSSDGLLAYVNADGSVIIVPIADASSDQEFTDGNGDGHELITLDGSASSDPDGAIVSYSWTEGGVEIATGISPQVDLSVGVHIITLTVTDDDGATATDEILITINPAPPPMPGTGLRGQYFDALNFATLKFFRVVPTIDFNWGTGSPATGAIAVDTFSIRWTGQVEPLYSETYTFYSTHNDGARLWVNGQQLINDWVNHASAVEQSGTISLTAGVKYDIVLEYYENTNSASVKLEWSSASQARQVIPASQLYPPRGQIAFTGRTSGNDDIFLISPDGSGEINLSNHTALEDSAAWSPDGTKLAFVSQRDGNKEIYLINADGTGLRRLTNHSATDDHIAWSPDGTQIAFHSARTAGGDIYKLSVTGTGIPTATRLTTNADAEQNPIWSPNGVKIIYERNVGGSNPEIYMMNPDGTSQTRLTNRAGYDVSPFVSPDGSKIAVRANYGAIGDEIIIVTISPLSVVRVTNNNAADYFQSWSSDSSKILFMSTRDGNAEVYSMNADGSNQTRLTDTPTGESYAVWSADSREIAFIRSGDIWLMNGDGSNQRNFSSTPSRTEREIVWWQAKQTY